MSAIGDLHITKKSWLTIKQWLLFTIITAVIFLLYGKTLNNYFIGEDMEWWESVRSLPFTDTWRLFLPVSWGGIQPLSFHRPLTGFLFWINTSLIPFTPLTMHFINIVLHGVNACLLYLLSLSIFKHRKTALAAVLFWIVFPFHSEAVVWGAGRSILLSTTWLLLYLLAYIKYRETRKDTWVWITTVALILGLLTRETAVIFPLFLFFWNLKKLTVKFRITQGLIIVTYILWHYLVIGSWSFFAVHQPVSFFPPSPVFILSACIGVGILFLLRKQKTFSGFELKWSAAALVISYLPYALTPTQERYVYTTSVFGILTLVLLGKRFTRQMPEYFRNIIILLLVIVLALWSFQRNERWVRAGNLNQNIVRQLSEHIKKSPEIKKWYLVNLPDNLDSVYIARTHLATLLNYELGYPPPQLIATPQTVGIVSHVEVVSPQKLWVKSTNGFVIFDPIPSPKPDKVTGDGYEVKIKTAQTLEITFAPQAPNGAQILVYQDRTLVPLSQVGL